MADNILGILFVTSSARGRNVFRYPPDPFSPLSRLSQPLYPSATFTVKDSLAQNDRTKLFPPGYNEKRNSHSSSKATRSGRNTHRAFDGSTIAEDQDYALRQGMDPEEDVGSSDSSVSSDSDSDNEKVPFNMPKRNSDAEARPHVNGGGSTIYGGSVGTRLHLDSIGAVKFDASRRGSAVDMTMKEKDEKAKSSLSNGHSKGHMPSPHDELFERQYDSALGYNLDFLGDMLTPPRAACNRKFEIIVDELLFIGHPVTNGADGKWAFPEEDDDDNVRHSARARLRRGRGDKDRSANGHTTNGGNNLDTVMESKEGTSPESAQSKNVERTSSEEKDGPPNLNMFHLVIVLDKPDPKGSGTEQEGNVNNLSDEIYREIAFKWTAAAFALQVRENWIAKHSWEVAKLKDQCFNEGVPVHDMCQLIYDKNPLQRALHQLFYSIHRLRNKPPNSHYSFLPMTFTATLADITINVSLPAASSKTDDDWVHFGEFEEEDSADEDSDSDDGALHSRMKRHRLTHEMSDIKVAPWFTLLLMDDDAVENAHSIAKAVVGMTIAETELAESTGDQTPMALDSRRGSKDVTAEEDEGYLMKSLIEACDVTKPLIEIAHKLRYDFDGIVVPLARQLVQNKRAILIDVVNTRLRTVVMLTSISEHTVDMDEYTLRFAQLFPGLPPLPTLLSLISTAPTQFREILPPEAPSGLSIRRLYMDALIWLFKQDLVVAVHTRARIFARPEIKEKAWRKLWHRRRERWLRKMTKANKTPLISPIDLTTPKAVLHNDPLAEIPTVPPPKQDSAGTKDTKENEVESDFEADSDWNEDGDDQEQVKDMGFSTEEVEPKHVPKFEGSFIFRPATAQKDEMRWLRAIREQAPDDVWASKFDLCVQYFDGVATFEEIVFRTGMIRKEIDRVVQLYPDDLVTFIHP